MEPSYVVVTSGAELALRLMASGRTRPAAVVSWHPEQQDNRIDVEHIFRRIGDLAEVYWLENGPESYAFGDTLPYGAHVFGNAARVYSEDLRWMTDVHRSPLRMARDRRTAARAAEYIIEDVLGRASAGCDGRTGRRQFPDGTIELSRVEVHDDFKP